MTEYQKLNGTFHHNGHVQGLENSISSLLTDPDESLIPRKTQSQQIYRKSAKLFINKKFGESYNTISKLIHESIELLNDNEIDEQLFINGWSLYLNLIDILINKSGLQDQQQWNLSMINKVEIESKYFSIDLFLELAELHSVVNPKLIVQILLIKLNNKKTDLTVLRQQIDIYIVNNIGYFSDENLIEFKDFQELLEIYYCHLLAKLGEFNEAERLIKSNSLIFEPEKLIKKLHQVKDQLKEEENQKKELIRKKHLQEKRAKEKAQKSLQKQIEQAKKAEAINKQSQNQIITKETVQEDLVSRFINLIKDRLIKFTNQQNAAIALLTLISLILFLKNNKYVITYRLRRYLIEIWGKFWSTLKMAFSVTYL
ncbi:hypothetical protein WICMUC_001151 [Wickerhamomyces mucosus]|uniref:Uncharacterized protein n=1 Tax=Wickerhamomyces mucosus TaxID=1378264 RepID=A0A9P8PX24_9ASCO|nr:hypothetical protein WICMUC_001151 [Wickerhamomyces mucosus]